MMLKAKVLSILFTLLLSSQPLERKEVFVESWKRGRHLIEERQFTINLNQEQHEYKTTIKDFVGKNSYELHIKYIESHGRLSDSWVIQLYKKPKRFGFIPLSKQINLFQGFYPGDVGDYFTDEDAIHWLYPLENPRPLDGVLCLPFRIKRVVKVERFYCIFQVMDYKVNPKNSKLLDSVTIKVEFTNKYEGQSKSAT